MSEYEDETSMMNNLCLRSQKMQYNRYVILCKKVTNSFVIQILKCQRVTIFDRQKVNFRIGSENCPIGRNSDVKNDYFLPENR